MKNNFMIIIIIKQLNIIWIRIKMSLKKQREKKIIDEEILTIEKYLDFYEKKYSDIVKSKIVIENQTEILYWLGQVRLALNSRNIKYSLKSLLNVHDLIFEYVPNLGERPWDDDLDRLLAKYSLNRD